MANFFLVSHFRLNGFLSKRSIAIYHLHIGFTVFIKDNINYKDDRMKLISINTKICILFQSQSTESHETAEYIRISVQRRRLCSHVIGNEEIFKNTGNSALYKTSLQICTGKNKCQISTGCATFSVGVQQCRKYPRQRSKLTFFKKSPFVDR